MPHQSLDVYHRAISSGDLASWQRKACFLCQAPLRPRGSRLRKVLNFTVFRAWCPQCETYFTFLPEFAIPQKWYGTDEVTKAVEFVDKRKANGSLSQALNEWENERTDRIDSGLEPGPSRSSVRRWYLKSGKSSTPSSNPPPQSICTKQQKPSFLDSVADPKLFETVSTLFSSIAGGLVSVALSALAFFILCSSHCSLRKNSEQMNLTVTLAPAMNSTNTAFWCFSVVQLSLPP